MIDIETVRHIEEQERIIKQLNDEVASLTHELAQWKQHHQDMVERNAVLRERHDLPVDRLPAHRRLIELQEENRQLKDLVAACRFIGK